MGFQFKFWHRKEGGRMSDTLWVRTVRVGIFDTHCYVVWKPGEERCVVIDPGADASAILRAAEGKHIDAILLTHGHFDHIGAIAGIRQDGTEIIIHKADAPLLTDPYRNAGWMVNQQVTAPEATRTVDEGDEVSAAGLTFRVLHTPGHTPGGVCYEVENALFTGDTMFAAGYGRTDLPGGDEQAMRQSLVRLLPSRTTHTIYAGHEG